MDSSLVDDGRSGGDARWIGQRPAAAGIAAVLAKKMHYYPHIRGLPRRECCSAGNLRGHAGRGSVHSYVRGVRILFDNLPGFPDNISFNGRDRFWLAIAAPRHPLVDQLADKVWLRQIVSRIPAWIRPKPKRHSTVFALNLNGKVIVNAQHAGAAAYWKITSACESGEWLYCGSVDETSIGRIPLKALSNLHR